MDKESVFEIAIPQPIQQEIWSLRPYFCISCNAQTVFTQLNSSGFSFPVDSTRCLCVSCGCSFQLSHARPKAKEDEQRIEMLKAELENKD